MPNVLGARDSQTVTAGGKRSNSPNIQGVAIVELGNVLTRSGWMTEIFRAEWAGVEASIQQINWVELNPGGVTDWHRHMQQTDQLVGVGGVIKLALWDGRESSPTRGQTDTIRFGAPRPVMVIVPPGVWHALRNESGRPAGYLNVTNRLYNYQNPDNWRLPPGTPDAPDIL